MTTPVNSANHGHINGLWRRYRGLPRNVFAIGLVSLLNDASSEIIYPLLPVFLATSLGASAKAIGTIEGLAESISSLLKLFAGYLSDRLAKTKVAGRGGLLARVAGQAAACVRADVDTGARDPAYRSRRQGNQNGAARRDDCRHGSNRAARHCVWFSPRHGPRVAP